MAPSGAGTSGPRPAQGARASWGCVAVLPDALAQFLGPQTRECEVCQPQGPYVQVYTHSGLGSVLLVFLASQLKPALALNTRQPPGREISPRGACAPLPTVSGFVLSAAFLGGEGGPGKTRAVATGPCVQRGEEAGPPPPRHSAGPPLPSLCRDGGRGRGSLVRPLLGPRCAPPPSALPGLRSRRRYHPLLARHFLSSPPRSPGRTAHLRPGAHPGSVPSLPGL